MCACTRKKIQHAALGGGGSTRSTNHTHLASKLGCYPKELVHVTGPTGTGTGYGPYRPEILSEYFTAGVFDATVDVRMLEANDDPLNHFREQFLVGGCNGGVLALKRESRCGIINH